MPIIILPLFIYNKSDCYRFWEKSECFLFFFVKQCSPIQSSNVLPAEMLYMSKSRIDTLCFDESGFIKLIKVSDIRKTHGSDGISVKMIKLWADSIAYPLTLIFENCLVPGIFASHWKQASFMQYGIKSLKSIFLTNSLPFSRRETCYPSISLVFVLLILIFINCLYYHTTIFLVLTLFGNLRSILRHIKSV